MSFIWTSMILAGAILVPLVLFGLAGDLARKLAGDYRGCVSVLFAAGGWAAALMLSGIPLAAMAVLVTYEEQNVGDAVKAVRPHAGRVARLLFVYAFIIVGSLGFFVLPGAFMALGFAFAPFICLFEGAQGLDALAGSREFFRGRAKALAARVLAPAAPFLVLPWIPGVGMILTFLCVPLFVAWQLTLYQETRAAMGARTTSWKSGRSYRQTALTGYALAAALLLSAAMARGVSASPPDTAFGAWVRTVRVRMMGFNGFLDRRLSKEGKEAMEEVGPKLVGLLAATEGKWKSLVSTAPAAPAVPASAAAPSAGVKIPPAVAAPQAAGGAWWRKYNPMRKGALSALASGSLKKAKGWMRFTGTKLLEWGKE